jgi:hypothetical protein
LKVLNLLPGFQSPANWAEIELFQEDRCLIHAEKDVAGDFLLSKHFAVLGLDPRLGKEGRNLIRVPGKDFGLRMDTALLFVCFVPIDVGEPWI